MLLLTVQLYMYESICWTNARAHDWLAIHVLAHAAPDIHENPTYSHDSVTAAAMSCRLFRITAQIKDKVKCLH